mgnify:CR=1 FL=1
MPRLIQHKAEAYWFYRFLSPLYDRWVNPLCAPDYMEQDFASTTPNEYLMKAAPLQGATYSIEAEQQILGAILTNNDIFDRISAVTSCGARSPIPRCGSTTRSSWTRRTSVRSTSISSSVISAACARARASTWARACTCTS